MTTAASYSGDETFAVADFGGPCPHVQALQQVREEWQQAEAAIRRIRAWLDTWAALDRRGYVTVGRVVDEVRAALDGDA